MNSLRDDSHDAIEENGVHLNAPVSNRQAEVLTAGALRFVAALAREFEPRRTELLQLRELQRHEIENGQHPDFHPETIHIRQADWKAAPIMMDLADRRVEIAGPTDLETMVAALNSGANVYVADFDDGNAPTWHNVVEGQVNLRDAIDGSVSCTDGRGQEQPLNERPATVVVRPRGLHLIEKHVTIDDEPISASLFDFGVYFFTNARTLINRGSAPYFCLPKIENYFEAKFWNEVFTMAQDALGIPVGTIRATVVIENIHAALQMDEILFELRHHAAGLACNASGYVTSIIKSFAHDPSFVLPDRTSISMDDEFLAAYTGLLIQTCHRRGVHAVGEMATQIPIKSDPLANAATLQRVREDKLREVVNGHDGTVVAHPDLVPIVKEVFDVHMEEPHQIGKSINGSIDASDLLRMPLGEITERGLRKNIVNTIVYFSAWLRGKGSVPIRNAIERATTAELSRTQLWQWIRHGVTLSDGRVVDRTLVQRTITDELGALKANIGHDNYTIGRFETAAEILENAIMTDDCPEHISLVAYNHID